MKQRVITAVVLLALLAVVVWQIYTPLFVIVIAFLSAVAANEIMKCAKVSNKFILCAGTAFAFCVPFFASAHILEPLVSTPQWALVINKVPNIVFVIVLTLAFFLAMLKEYSHTKFEDVAVSFIASAVCGVITGFALNLIAMLLYNHFADSPLTQTQAIVLMCVEPLIGVMSMMGDLSASVLKRNFGVKDFGKIFPGHGGVMDRFDSSLFTLPLTYCVAMMVL